MKETLAGHVLAAVSTEADTTTIMSFNSQQEYESNDTVNTKATNNTAP